ncbi:hypothetical protein CONPUDRAFT_156570 [Coniophora puteana RWD-64-598 SS2]|uniref:Uncharacterized protein n=1 Tax=Coniophora puteana (strain RWD-64-598) TaxID=741705 RepID=A0A5M3MIX4_CONPW|nr:uncharacterized protein CONPUDRAFT_156570 [Coniophora puteana RWD-64-598 SS2]EIW78595.1 hypothetical protein CONPUDRAFT_156570 [Coniophora puteana RWD-64-598 SS2]
MLFPSLSRKGSSPSQAQAHTQTHTQPTPPIVVIPAPHGEQTGRKHKSRYTGSDTPSSAGHASSVHAASSQRAHEASLRASTNSRGTRPASAVPSHVASSHTSSRRSASAHKPASVGGGGISAQTYHASPSYAGSYTYSAQAPPVRSPTQAQNRNHPFRPLRAGSVSGQSYTSQPQPAAPARQPPYAYHHDDRTARWVGSQQLSAATSHHTAPSELGSAHGTQKTWAEHYPQRAQGAEEWVETKRRMTVRERRDGPDGPVYTSMTRTYERAEPRVVPIVARRK